MDVNRLLRGRTGVLNCSGTGTLGLLGSAAYPCIELEFRVAIDANNDNNPECELALPNIGVVSNDNSSCSGFKYFAGATNSNGIVKVASDGSRIECVKLSFTNAAMEAIYMTFLVNYPNNSGTTQGDCTVNNGSTQQFEYGYVTTNVGPCSKRFTITIKNKTTGGNTITGLACP